MRVPPLDVFRQPLVEPLGHLVMQAAYLDNALYSFVALLIGPETDSAQVAHELRNWDARFVDDAIAAAISDKELATDLHNYVRRVGEARDERHRMIHDAMEVGLDDAPQGGFQAIILREGYQRRTKHETVRTLTRVTPDEVAALAYRFYDLRIEVDTLFGRWHELGGPPAPSVF
jgi:hypothetical protein